VLGEEVVVEVMPLGVGFFDEADFPLAFPCLEALFAEDGIGGVCERFVVDKTMDAVALGEAGDVATFVAGDSLDEVAGDADVEGAVLLAGHDVDVVGLASGHGSIVGAAYGWGQGFREDRLVRWFLDSCLRRNDKVGSRRE